MHFLLCIADRLNVERKSDKDASYNDLKVLTHDDLTSLNQIMRESKSNRKIMSESKINKIEKIMQTDNASSYQQLIYCNRQRENKSQKLSFFKRYIIIKKMQIC
jgi:hypothetical protein